MNIEIKEREPNKSTPSTPKKIIGVQVTQEVYDALVKKSEEEWLTVPGIIRKLIKDYLKKEVK